MPANRIHQPLPLKCPPSFQVLPFRRRSLLNLTCLAIGAMIFFSGSMAQAKCNEKWEDWHDAIRGKRGVLKVKYQVCSDKEFNFKVYKNKDWDGNKNEWDKIDSFTITPGKASHNKKFPKFYTSVIGPISVNYEIKADFKKRKVHSKGSITSPIPKTFPVRTQTKKWNQDFFTIPATGNIITTEKDGYTFVEVSELWMGLCSDIACGPWVQFPAYSETHRYRANLPKIGPVIIQLWKGFCPNLGETSSKYNFGGLVNLLNLGKEFPGGIGAEVGIYRPIGKKTTMVEAATRATPLGLGEWEPLVVPDLKISFQLVNPKTGEVLVDAPEKNTWWRTKWITAESFERYKKSHAVPAPLLNFNFTEPFGKIAPAEVLSYELRYTINGVVQPAWKSSLFPGQYPEIGFNGIWRLKDPWRHFESPRGFEILEMYNNGRELEVSFDQKDFIKIPLNGKIVRGSDMLGSFEVSARESGKSKEKLALTFKYKKEEFDLKKELVNKANLAAAEVNRSQHNVTVQKLEFEHTIEFEILLPSHSLALHGVAPLPLVYDAL